MTKFNSEVVNLIMRSGLNVNKSLLYLLSIRHELQTEEMFGEYLKSKINTLNIFTYDGASVVWNYSLFVADDQKFQWVREEYLACFKVYNKHNKYKDECVSRMKKFFASNPDIRKDDVIGATKMYIKECISNNTPSQYVTNPHYFIYKSMRTSDKESKLTTYCELYMETKINDSTGDSTTTAMRS